MSEAQDDLFIKRIKVEVGAQELFADMVRHDNFARILAAMDATKALLPGMMLARHVVSELMAKADQAASQRTYFAASRAGVKLHEIVRIGCESENDEIWVVAHMEGGAT